MPRVIFLSLVFLRKGKREDRRKRVRTENAQQLVAAEPASDVEEPVPVPSKASKKKRSKKPVEPLEEDDSLQIFSSSSKKVPESVAEEEVSQDLTAMKHKETVSILRRKFRIFVKASATSFSILPHMSLLS